MFSGLYAKMGEGGRSYFAPDLGGTVVVFAKL
jgi:hypothetical protein